MLSELEPVPSIRCWHCVLFGNDYDGDKHCVKCGTRI
ncbi:TPA: hypothetical protein RQO86_004424 [Klebsiella michiganensis]|nr:hypothetical protein [Klebsiella michiganensis]